MGMLDSLKARLGPAKGRVSDLAQQHGDRIDQGLDKAARMVDGRTKGKYSDQIRTGTGRAKDALDRFAARDRGDGRGGGAGGPTPPPAA